MAKSLIFTNGILIKKESLKFNIATIKAKQILEN